MIKLELEQIVKKYDFNKITNYQKGFGIFHQSATPDKWKESFSEEEKQIMNNIMGSILKKLGNGDN